MLVQHHLVNLHQVQDLVVLEVVVVLKVVVVLNQVELQQDEDTHSRQSHVEGLEELLQRVPPSSKSSSSFGLVEAVGARTEQWIDIVSMDNRHCVQSQHLESMCVDDHQCKPWS